MDVLATFTSICDGMCKNWMQKMNVGMYSLY
ncbi:hypothetical protein T11_14890 [Trichinella zimbabwensis]|uniref:Uncharacterized protein n=1 Tax=Trichinella zimbabwensis TaxID=268475 RepID=A0A0V1G9M8_9BILA|nr:hypothetical protein T11_14890 [Trichinella zimbabwensis]